jgi:hypothetical protein
MIAFVVASIPLESMHGYCVNSAAFFPDSKLVASGSADDTVMSIAFPVVLRV